MPITHYERDISRDDARKIRKSKALKLSKAIYDIV